MTAPNHIVGGIVITGLFGSFMNLNILASPWYIATTIFASLLPDIDHTRSIIGKFFLPFSKYLNRRYGHRTITHSLMALLLSSLFFAFLETFFYHSSQMAKTYFLAYMSHLILDMMTVQGVPLLYPFMRNPCVLPGNPEMRFRTGNLRTETMIFCFFLLSAIFLQPLIKNGFWTQYNRFFGTPKHLASEFRKSDDALLVKYIVKKGTEEISGEGICIEANDSKIILLEKNGFHQLDKVKYAIREVIPEHTGQALRFEQVSFVDIAIDSLNTLVQDAAIQKIDIQSNNVFVIHHGNFQERSKRFKVDYPKQLWFQLIEQKVDKELLTFYPNPKIKTLENQIQMLNQQHHSLMNEYQNIQIALNNLKTKYALETNLSIKERLLKKINLLEKVALPKLDNEKLKTLAAKIEELKQVDQIKKLELQQSIDQKYLATLPAKTKFTGAITKISILN